MIRELLEVRRARSEAFAIPPVVDLKQWLGFYKSPKRVEAAAVRAIYGEEGDDVLRLIGAMLNPKGADEETQLTLLGAITAFFKTQYSSSFYG
jgi:hypothetical protein